MRKLFVLLLTLLSLPAFPVNISVRIYSTDNLKTVIFAPKTGKYFLLGDGKFIDSLTTWGVYEISNSDGNIAIKSLDRPFGKFSSLQIKECSSNCSFNIKSSAEKSTRLYNGDLQVSNDGGFLKLINNVEFEYYLAGVVECEGGHNRPLEFYKAQSIICRTYALSNLVRHLGEYYELCDAVHCQAYKGTCTIPEIVNAVQATKGLVITDTLKHLINAAYFSNCGGYTLNSEDVWSTYVPYLRAVKDTFCRNQLHATWEKRYSLKDWTSYLEKKESTLTGQDAEKENYWNSIPADRRIYLYDNGYLIPLKDIRLELNLHSTCFTIEKNDTEIILKGRGNGHRVGFCQEGAIRMSELGYSYLQILQFYYRGIQVLDSMTLPIDTGTN